MHRKLDKVLGLVTCSNLRVGVSKIKAGYRAASLELITNVKVKMSNSNTFTRDILLALLGLFVPPLPVAMKRGVFSLDTLLNLILCLLGGLPGVVHCWYIIVKYPDDGIPFVDSARGRYRIVPDVEDQSSNQTAHPNYQSTSTTSGGGDVGGAAGPIEPPSYDQTIQRGAPAKGDNKVQYSDNQV